MRLEIYYLCGSLFTSKLEKKQNKIKILILLQALKQM